MTSRSDVVQLLAELHEEYVWRVNEAVGEGREDLIERLRDEYADRALATIVMVEGPASAA